jgi:hypothetical protein
MAALKISLMFGEAKHLSINGEQKFGRKLVRKLSEICIPIHIANKLSHEWNTLWVRHSHLI